MKLDSTCNQVFVVAVNEAKLQSHEYVTPEHYLYAALMFDRGKQIIENGGGDLEKIKKDLNIFFDKYIPNKVTNDPIESSAFVQIFEMALNHARNSGKEEITLGDLIVVMYNLNESHASYILRKNGADRLKILTYISHELPKAEEKAKERKDKKDTTNKEEILKTYAVNLTERARQNNLDPLVGREDILNRTIQVLCRRLKNNPIHVGDPGVGKTAIVEGLAQKIIEGTVPKILEKSNIFYIDMGSVLAGTRYRGDFEERLLKILEAIAETQNPIIYLDEIHTIVGAGAVSGGSADATSILKPYLAKGGIRFIGSTTFEEYKKYFEKDRALVRRFQKIDVTEPTIDQCKEILKGLREKYEKFHNVIYTDEVISIICELSSKYMQDKFLPDKAIDIMDEAGAFITMNEANGFKHVIIRKDIERTVAQMAKVPINIIVESEVDKLKKLGDNLKKEIFGQDSSIEAIVDAIKTSYSGLKENNKPIASLLFVGPTGVGKTEIAKQLAFFLDIKLERFDMSEYQEKHSVARLIGSPPGYVGYEQGGILTDTIRRTPHCVLLLDEIEKAHGDILNVLLQVMDYGNLTDNLGKKADFRNVIIIMTSNAGAKELGKRVIGFDSKAINISAIDKEVEKVFSPEFRNRLDSIVLFNSVNDKMAYNIAKKAVNKLGEKLLLKNIKLTVTPNAVAYIASKGLNETYGAREIIRVVDQEIKKMLVDEVLFGGLSKGGAVTVGYSKAKIQIKI